MPSIRFPEVLAIALAAAAALQPAAAAACTTFCLRDGSSAVFGRNYDWNTGDGLLIVNKRHLTKRSLGEPGERGQPASWTSRYGSVTFNQYGREEPTGGMNEAGLVVELMWLNEAQYPKADARPSVGVLEWIQYQLDHFATVQEVLDNASKLRIASKIPLHYLVCERGGQCATIEWLGGELVVHSGEKLPVQVLTNSTYADGLQALREREGAGASAPSSGESLDRFVRVAQRLRQYPGSASRPAVQEAFEVLDLAAQPGSTQWSIVYDLAELRIHYRTLTQPRVRTLSLANLDFSCATPARYLDLDASGEGEVATHLAEYTTRANRELIGRSYAKVDFLKDIPAETLDAIGKHPESSVCTQTQ